MDDFRQDTFNVCGQNRMDHTWRLDRRRSLLEAILDSEKLEQVWTKYLKSGFRKQNIPDLHDYNDWNNNRNIEFKKLKSDAMSGGYRPKQAFFYTTEKNLEFVAA